MAYACAPFSLKHTHTKTQQVTAGAVFPLANTSQRCSSLLVQPAELRVVVWLARRQDVCRGLCHGVGPRRLAALRSVKAFSSVNVPLSQNRVHASSNEATLCGRPLNIKWAGGLINLTTTNKAGRHKRRL